MGQGTVPDRLGDPFKAVGVVGGLAVLVSTDDHAVPIQNIPRQRGCQIFAGLRRKKTARQHPVARTFALCSFPCAEPRLPVIVPIDEQLGHQADRQRGEHVDHRMLFDKRRGKTDHHDHERQQDFPHRLELPVLKPHGHDAHRIRYVKRGAHACRGVEGVDKGHQPGEEVVAHEHVWPQILARGVEDVDRHRDELGDEDKERELGKALGIIQQRIDQRSENQRIPEDVKDGEVLAEGDHVVERTVHRVADLRRDQIFGQKVETEIKEPAENCQLHMGKLGRIEL